MTLQEAISEYGPCVLFDDDTHCAVTVNGSYFNLWFPRGGGDYANVECRGTGIGNGLYDMTVAEAMDHAQDFLDDVLAAVNGEHADD